VHFDCSRDLRRYDEEGNGIPFLASDQSTRARDRAHGYCDAGLSGFGHAARRAASPFGVTVQGADQGDTTTIHQTRRDAAEQLDAVAEVADEPVAIVEEVVADKGYHSRITVYDLKTMEIRTYISEPERGRQSWISQGAERDAVYANRRRIGGTRGQRLLRRRGELLERPCAHLYETGGLRRVSVRGHLNVLKRLLVHASGFNLALAMRTRFGVGTPRARQRHARDPPSNPSVRAGI
jgi:hypothetical protein